MKNFLRWVLITFLVLALLLTLAAAWVSRQFNPKLLKPRTEDILSRALRSPVTVETVAWRWLPKPYFSVSGVDLHREHGPQILISEIRISPNLKKILSKKITFEEIEVYQPQITLVRDNKGRFFTLHKATTPVTAAVPDQNAEASFFVVNFRTIQFTEATVTIDGGDPDSSSLTKIFLDGTVDLSTHETLQPFKLLARVIRQEDEAAVALSGTFGSKVEIDLETRRAPVGTFADIFPILNRLSGLGDIQAKYSVMDQGAVWSAQGSLYSLTIKDHEDSPVGKGKFSMSSEATGKFNFEVESEKTKAAVQVEVPLTATAPVYAHVQADPIDWDDIRSWKSAEAKEQKPAQKNDRPVILDIAAKNMQFERGVVDLALASATRRGTDVTIDQLTLHIFGGTATASGLFTPSNFYVQWDQAGFDALSLLDFFGQRRILSGTVSSYGKMSGQLPSDIKTYRGDINVRAVNGAVLEAPGVLKLISALNLTSLLQIGKKADEKSLPFDVILATVSVQNGVLVFDWPGIFSNNTLQIGFQGKVDLPANNVDMKIAINFLDIASELINMIPGVRTIILGGRKTLVPLFVKVTGPRENPKIDVESAKSISAGAWGTVTSVLKYPFGLKKYIFPGKKPDTKDGGQPE